MPESMEKLAYALDMIPPPMLWLSRGVSFQQLVFQGSSLWTLCEVVESWWMGPYLRDLWRFMTFWRPLSQALCMNIMKKKKKKKKKNNNYNYNS